MKPSANTIFIILTAVIVAGGTYWYFFIETATEPAVSTSEPVQSITQAEFQTLVTELEPVDFDTRIFEDARFSALRDITTPVAPEALGRNDPFAPIAGVSAQ